MKMATLPKVYMALLHGWPAVEVDPDVAALAVKSIDRMLMMSAELGL